MTAIARSMPPERDDPRNAMLDLIEASIRTALDQDLEMQLRARLARLLPAPMPAAAREPVDPLLLAQLLTACREMASHRLRGPQHEAIARFRQWIVSELDAGKKDHQA